VLRNLHVITHRGGLMHLMSSRRRKLQQQQQQQQAPGSGDSKVMSDTNACPDSGNSNRHSRPLTGSQGHLWVILKPKQLSSHDALSLMGVYLAAIIHDYDHRGLTNAFLIQDEDPLAVGEF
jgi:hypothetical protein